MEEAKEKRKKKEKPNDKGAKKYAILEDMNSNDDSLYHSNFPKIIANFKKDQREFLQELKTENKRQIKRVNDCDCKQDDEGE